MQHVTGQVPREQETMAWIEHHVEKFNIVHPPKVSFSWNYMFYIIINNSDFYSFCAFAAGRESI